jgi:hypothetical protein
MSGHFSPMSTPITFRGARPPRSTVGDVGVAVAVCSTVTVAFCAVEPQIRHWFALPVTACGILLAVDAVPWLRGKCDRFDPVGIVGLLGVHFFFLAPLLHVYWNYWLRYVIPPSDWRPWLGGMAILNVVGLLVYRAIVSRSVHQRPSPRPAAVWRIDKTRFFTVGLLLVTVSVVLQAWVYASSGGITGYIEIAGGGSRPFAGMGWVFIISESAPIVALMVLVVATERSRVIRRPWAIAIILVSFVILVMLFGGLRGSRSNTVWAVFWAAGMIHYRIRPLSRSAIAIGLVGLCAFMYFYGFYKSASTDAQFAMISRADRLDLEAKTGRTLETLVLGDLARSDVQAFELYRLTAARDTYALAWGRTYLGALALLVPATVWPSRPSTKVQEGTNLLYGADTYASGAISASNVYGVAGELMLNFGPIAIPLGFAVLGLWVATISKALRSWAPEDGRWLIAPILVNLCFVIIVSDLDNVLVFVLKSLSIPLILLLFGTRRGKAKKSRRQAGIEPLVYATASAARW